MIRAGNISDIDSILNVTKSCALYMIDNEIYQWNETYPDRKSFLDDVKNKELYVYCEKDKVVACISLCNKMDKVYEKVVWNTENRNNLYIHRLAVHPDFQKKGVTAILFNSLLQSLKNKGIKECIRTPELKDNKEISKLWKNFNPITYKTRCTFKKSI